MHYSDMPKKKRTEAERLVIDYSAPIIEVGERKALEKKQRSQKQKTSEKNEKIVKVISSWSNFIYYSIATHNN